MNKGRLVALSILIAAGAPAAANEAIIYRDTGFSGPAVNVTSARSDLGLRYNVNAIRVQSGRWELCPERNFRGRCIMVSRSSPNLFAQYGWAGPLGSMRPAGWGGGSGGGGGQFDNPSLRGMAAEFFPRPADRGGRI
ncbi:beta/gamma crystallin-related protein, partial [Thermaurantiacus sp.]